MSSSKRSKKERHAIVDKRGENGRLEPSRHFFVATVDQFAPIRCDEFVQHSLSVKGNRSFICSVPNIRRKLPKFMNSATASPL